MVDQVRSEQVFDLRDIIRNDPVTYPDGHEVLGCDRKMENGYETVHRFR